MNTTTTTEGERTLARRIFMVLAASCLAALALAASSEAESLGGAAAGPLLSRSAEPTAGGYKPFFSVPGGKAFLLTQACLEHGAMKMEVSATDGTFAVSERGCTDFLPAYVVDGAATFHCRNLSGQMRACQITGRVVNDAASSRRAAFIDVDETLSATR